MTHVVVHNRLYLGVGGKLQHVPAGTEISLTDNQAKSLMKQGKVRKIGSAKQVKVEPVTEEKAEEK
jgi:hypothetical protein